MALARVPGPALTPGLQLLRAAYIGWAIVGDLGTAGQFAVAALVLASITIPAWLHVQYRARRAARLESAG